jgi:hypothetical protein
MQFSFTKKIDSLFLVFAVFLTTSFLNAQDINVSFKIMNGKKEPVPFVSITVANRIDTLQIFNKVSDSSGAVTFNLQKGVQYKVTLTSVNYQPLEKGITVTTSQNSFAFSLEQLPKTLNTVVVRSSKPLMRQEDDKTIVDPENLAASSTNGYEILEKTPGLFVDQDGNIYIASTTPATILINGREMKMSNQDIATMLKSLPPNAIASIEIVRTPSAKYDASSSGGIVNVILKKGVKIGMTGSVNAGLQQGTYGNQFIGGNINNNDGKKSSFINLNYARRNSYERIITDRLFTSDTLLSQDAFTKYPASTYFAGYGLQFPVGKKWDIDFGTSGSLNDYDNKTSNLSSIKKISTSQTLAENLDQINNEGSSVNFRTGVEIKLKIDSLGSEWVNDLFYNFTQNKAEQDFIGGNGTSNNTRNFYQLKSDLVVKMKKRFTLETGAKSTLLNYKSVTDYYKESNGGTVKDISRTNTFNYEENINSLYLQGSKTLGKDFVLKAGTRLENTNMKGRQIIPDDTSFNIHRTDLFPYVYLSKKVISIAGFELRAYLVYRRTISRPVYEQLNPFPRYVDQFLSETGNPSLRPQFNNNYEANISVNETPLLAIGLNKTKDIFTNVIYLADSSHRQAYKTYDNLGSNKEFYIRGLGAIPPGKKYFFVLGAQYNHNFYQGIYEKSPLSFKKGSWTIFTYHTLKLGTRSLFTLNGFVRLKGQLQFYELSTFGSLNASINRQFLKQKLIVTISMQDLFFSNRNDFTIDQGSVKASGSRLADTRRFGINMRYNFGLRKKEEGNNMFNVESPEKAN